MTSAAHLSLWQKIPWRAVRVIVGMALLLALIFVIADWRQLITVLQTVNPLHVSAMFGLQLIALVISALRWRILLRADGDDTPLARLMHYYLISFFFNVYLPPYVGADAVRIVSMREQVQPGTRIVSVLIERGFGLLSLLSVGFVAVLANPALRQYSVLTFIVIGAGFAVVTIIIFLLVPECWLWASRIFEKLPRVYQLLMDIGAAGKRFRRQGRALAATLLLSFSIQVLVVLSFHLRALALGVDISVWQTMLVAPAITLLTLIPLSPGGIGTTETFATLAYTSLGIDAPTALALALLARPVELAMALLGAIVWLRDR